MHAKEQMDRQRAGLESRTIRRLHISRVLGEHRPDGCYRRLRRAALPFSPGVVWGDGRGSGRVLVQNSWPVVAAAARSAQLSGNYHESTDRRCNSRDRGRKSPFLSRLSALPAVLVSVPQVAPRVYGSAIERLSVAQPKVRDAHAAGGGDMSRGPYPVPRRWPQDRRPAGLRLSPWG